MSETNEHTPRIVIAEDEAIIRMDLKEILIEEGYDVVADVGRGDTALDTIRDLKPDVALLDVKMPGMDGVAVARAVASERICAVVLLTAFSQRQLISEATEAGVNGYLVKPFQRSDLVPSLEVAMGRFAELASSDEERAALKEQLAVRRLVDRAKGRLLDEHQMSEADAFDFLQRTAMNERIALRDVAEAVIAGNLAP